MNLIPVMNTGIFYFSDLNKFAFFHFNNKFMSAYFKIGTIVAAHGLNGEIVLKHELGKKSSLKGLQVVFIEDKNKSLLPWFIQSASIKNKEEIYLKLEGVDVREAALKFIKKDIWVPEVDFKKFVAKSSPINLLGYHI